MTVAELTEALVPAFVVRVHGEEAKDEEVHGGRHHGQPEEDEEDAEGNVLGAGLQDSVLLQGDHVTEPDRGEGDDAVVERVEVGPALAARERPRPADHDQDGRGRRHQGQMGVADLGVTDVEDPAFDSGQDERGEGVEPLSDALEHDEVERDSQERVEHAEDLTVGRLRGTVSVPCNTKYNRCLW